MDVPLAHLDRLFDYLVPAELADQARPGTRVRVRFANQLVDGWIIERAALSGHDGRLSYLDRLVSPEPVLTPEIARLARAVADRYAGNLCDVLRLAVPPRHARVERESAPPGEPTRTTGAATGAGGTATEAGPAADEPRAATTSGRGRRRRGRVGLAALSGRPGVPAGPRRRPCSPGGLGGAAG